MSKTLHHYIGGKKVEGKSGRFGDVFNPAAGEVSAQVPLASADEVRQAIAVAAEAFPAWAKSRLPECAFTNLNVPWSCGSNIHN